MRFFPQYLFVFFSQPGWFVQTQSFLYLGKSLCKGVVGGTDLNVLEPLGM